MIASLEDHGSQAGLTLLDMMLVLAILGAVGVGIMRMSRTSQKAFQATTTFVDLDGKANDTVERVQRELRTATLGSLVSQPRSPLWDDEIAFDQVADVSGLDGSLTLESMHIGFQYDEGETDDGIDNDGDGLIDEGRVVLTRDWNGSSPRPVVLCTNVSEMLQGELANGIDDNGNGLIDELGFCFELSKSKVTVRLSLQRHDRDHGTMTRSAEIALLLRN